MRLVKKDVLFMCQFFYPDYVTSASLTTDLAEDLVKKGLSVGVLTGYPKEYFNGKAVKKEEEYQGISIKRVKYLHLNRRGKLGRLINFLSFFIAILLHVHILFQYRCIVVYSSPPILPLIPCLTRSKFMFIAMDIYPDVALLLGALSEKSIITKFMDFINRKVYKRASCVVAVGTEMKQHILKRGFTDDSKKIQVVSNWYDKQKISREIHNLGFKSLRNKWPFIVLYSGNMGTCQDLNTILNCMLRFKNSKRVLFLFTGHGNKVDQVKTFIRENEISNAQVYGFLLNGDHSDVLNIADCCLVSLEKGVEGLGVPSKTYSYLAAGKPVLAIMSKETDIVRTLETYHAGNTVLQGDVEGLERLIKEYIEDEERLKQCRINALKAYEALYERKLCTEKYYNIITTVIEREYRVSVVNQNV